MRSTWTWRCADRPITRGKAKKKPSGMSAEGFFPIRWSRASADDFQVLGGTLAVLPTHKLIFDLLTFLQGVETGSLHR